MHEQIQNIAREFKKLACGKNDKENQIMDGEEDTSDYQLHIVIHSMDAGQFKNEDCQSYIAELAEIPQIKLIVSVDHQASGRMWSETHLDKLNMYSVQIDTFLQYDKEFEKAEVIILDNMMKLRLQHKSSAQPSQ